MTKRKYSVIVFDLGNVLIPFDYSRMTDNLNSVKPGLGDKFYKRYKENYHVHRSFETWELSNDQFLDIMIEWCEGLVDREYFCKIYSDLFTENKEVSSLLPKLKENYTLVLLSNTNDIHKRYGWEKYEFLKNFDRLVLSHEAGAVKPEEKIYREVEEFTKKSSAEHIFIDDVKEYGLGAEKLGWDSIHFTGYQNLIEEFAKREILI